MLTEAFQTFHEYKPLPRDDARTPRQSLFPMNIQTAVTNYRSFVYFRKILRLVEECVQREKRHKNIFFSFNISTVINSVFLDAIYTSRLISQSCGLGIEGALNR